MDDAAPCDDHEAAEPAPEPEDLSSLGYAPISTLSEDEDEGEGHAGHQEEEDAADGEVALADVALGSLDRDYMRVLRQPSLQRGREPGAAAAAAASVPLASSRSVQPRAAAQATAAAAAVASSPPSPGAAREVPRRVRAAELPLSQCKVDEIQQAMAGMRLPAPPWLASPVHEEAWNSIVEGAKLDAGLGSKGGAPRRRPGGGGPPT